MLATHSYYEKMDLAQETQMDVNFFTTRVIRIKKWEASEKRNWYINSSQGRQIPITGWRAQIHSISVTTIRGKGSI